MRSVFCVRTVLDTPVKHGEKEAAAPAASTGGLGLEELGKSEIEIRPFYEAADLAEFMTPEELSAPREGQRGKLGVA
jgi:hypothetical protein